MTKSIDCKISKDGKFDEYTYSKPIHMNYFLEMNYDTELYGYKVDPDDCSLKVYQDLLVFAFVKENLPPGSKMLDIGGGYSRILNYFKNDYECWNIDKLEGLGNGPTEMDMDGINLVLDYMGNFNKELPDNYFDFVFSISALEHVPEDNPELFSDIFKDIQRVSKDNAFIFHCFDVVIKGDYVWTNQLLIHFFENSVPLNDFIDFETLKKASDIYVMSEKYYDNNWISATNKSYEDFGKPLSYNILWKNSAKSIKDLVEGKMINFSYRLPEYTKTKSDDSLNKNPAYVFHHIIKCGGTSVFNKLDKWFNIVDDYRSYVSPDEFMIFKDVNKYNLYKLNINHFGSDYCMVSHFDTVNTYIHKKYPEILLNKDKFRLFTFVRDPFDLVVSLHYFNLKENNNFNLKDSLKFYRNLLSFQFPCNENNYKEVIDRYFFIGITENLQESFDKLADLTGKRKIKLPVNNKSEKDSQIEELKNNNEYMESFRNWNYLDYLVYDYCKEKYSKF